MAHALIFTLVLTHLARFRNTTSFTRRAGYCAYGFSGYNSSYMNNIFSEQMKNLDSGDNGQQDRESWAAGSDGVTWRNIRGRRWTQNILFMVIFPFRNFNQCFSPAGAWFSRFCWNLEAVDCSVKDALRQFHVIKNCRILKVENETWEMKRGEQVRTDVRWGADERGSCKQGGRVGTSLDLTLMSDCDAASIDGMSMGDDGETR